MSDNKDEDTTQKAGEDKKVEQGIDFSKGLPTLDVLRSKFQKKATQEAGKAFEKKFGELFKKRKDAEAILKAIDLEIEDEYTKFKESI